MSKVLCTESSKGKCQTNKERPDLNFWVMLLTGGSPDGTTKLHTDSNVVFMDFSSFPSFFTSFLCSVV